MKVETSIENKVKFFSLYSSQNIISVSSYSDMKTPYQAQFINDGRDRQLASMAHLKPLSSISDEDAKKLLYDSASKFKRASNARLHIDELRAMGYAMNWHGLTVDEMVQAGWIKLK